MITDNFLRLSGSLTAGSATGQTITATANSTNVVDLSLARDIGEGEELYVQFTLGPANWGAGTSLTPTIVVADDTALTTNAVTIGTGGLIPVATLVAGYTFAVRLNPIIASLGRRYLGVIYTVAGSNFTTATITADIVTEIQDGKKYYASGIPTLSNT